MSKYNLKEFLENKLKEYKSTFKNTSYDDSNNRYLCSDETILDVYNFDSYIKNNFDNSKLPSSPDAIYLGNKKLYFIEFKHQKSSAIDSSNIKAKFEKGTTILKEMIKEFVPKDNKFIFCVVFENEKKSKYFNSSHIESNSVKFGLQDLNKNIDSFYDEIITRDLDFYKENFQNLKCG